MGKWNSGRRNSCRGQSEGKFQQKYPEGVPLKKLDDSYVMKDLRNFQSAVQFFYTGP